MENKILEFIRLLRDSGARISTSEGLDAYRALQMMDIFERESFRLSLRTTLVKDVEDVKRFDKLFDLYFQEPIDDTSPIEIPESEFEDQLKQMENMLNQEGFEQLGKQKDMGKQQDEPTPPQDMPRFNQAERNKQLYTQGSESEMQSAAQEMANSRKFEDWETDNIESTIERVMAENGMNVAKVEAKHSTRRDKQPQIDVKHKQLKEMVRDEVEKAMVRQFGNEVLSDIMDSIDLMDVDLSSLTHDQLEEIKEKVQRIAKKISTRNSHREKLGKRGKIDVAKTIRSSIQYGNVASELRFKRKKKSKPKLVLFCDVSGSVYTYVSFMLQLVLALQKSFSQVESYVFVDKIKHVTGELAEIDDIFDLVKRYTNDPYLGFASDFGLAFDLFAKEDIFDKKTVVLVVADAVNYEMDARPDRLKDISDKAKAVYWLNPLEERFWDERGCAMNQYRPHCTQVYECRNLSQLEDFIKQLVKL